MQSYVRITEPIKALTKSLFPRTVLSIGSIHQNNQKAAEAREVFVSLNEQFSLNREAPDASHETTKIMIDAGVVTRTDPNALELRNAKGNADLVCDAILEALPAVYDPFWVEVGNINRVPYTAAKSSTMAGFVMEIDLIIAGCSFNSIGELYETAQRITGDISPLDLKVTTNEQ